MNHNTELLRWSVPFWALLVAAVVVIGIVVFFVLLRRHSVEQEDPTPAESNTLGDGEAEVLAMLQQTGDVGKRNAQWCFASEQKAWADECLAKFPKHVFAQWTCDHYIRPKSELTWTEAGKVSPDARRHIMRAHVSTYWGRYRGELAVDWIAGFDTISLFGKVSPFHAGAELNYLALADFGSRDNPQADLDDFLHHVADPLLGGEGSGHDFLRYARLLENRGKIPPALKEINVRLGTLPPEAARRWTWLANFLASFVYRDA